MSNQAVKLSRLLVRKKKKIKEKKYDNQNGYRFEFLKQSQFGALMDSRIAESVFNQLFLRNVYIEDYFRPVEINTPLYQIWEVRGDTYAGSDSPEL